MPKIYDFVVVGGGSAGCVMASRLSENPKLQVCLLEAGKPDKDLRIHVPGMLGELLASGAHDWHYSTTPQRHLNGRSVRWPRGKTMGGSSSVNAMCYQRGALSDYDDWAATGIKGWSGLDALHYFKKSEKYSGGADQWHGDQGPLAVSRPEDLHPATQKFLVAAAQAGYRHVQDFHNGNREGFGAFDTTTENGRRCSAAKAYLSQEVQERPNLTIETGAMVTSIILDGKRAAGVVFKQNGSERRVAVSREVILSGGTINTPQLMLLSGIGPASHLKDVGIKTVVDLPGVGENLQDHVDVALQMNTRKGSAIGYTPTGLAQIAGSLVQYAVSRKGIMASNLAEGCGFSKSRAGVSKPDIQFHFLPGMSDDHGKERFIGEQGVTLHACCLYPKSRGTIRLNSKNPFDQPAIDPNYLSHEEDWDVLIAGCEQAYQIMHQPAFKDIRKGMRMPLDQPQTKEGWRGIIRSRADTIYHPVGTCKMGPQVDEMSVTNNAGRVHHMKGLRVVDASLMPKLIGGNTNAPTIMMAEKIVTHMMSQLQ